MAQEVRNSPGTKDKTYGDVSKQTSGALYEQRLRQIPNGMQALNISALTQSRPDIVELQRVFAEAYDRITGWEQQRIEEVSSKEQESVGESTALYSDIGRWNALARTHVETAFIHAVRAIEPLPYREGFSMESSITPPSNKVQLMFNTQYVPQGRSEVREAKDTLMRLWTTCERFVNAGLKQIDNSLNVDMLSPVFYLRQQSGSTVQSKNINQDHLDRVEIIAQHVLGCRLELVTAQSVLIFALLR